MNSLLTEVTTRVEPSMVEVMGSRGLILSSLGGNGAYAFGGSPMKPLISNPLSSSSLGLLSDLSVSSISFSSSLVKYTLSLSLSLSFLSSSVLLPHLFYLNLSIAISLFIFCSRSYSSLFCSTLFCYIISSIACLLLNLYLYCSWRGCLCLDICFSK